MTVIARLLTYVAWHEVLVATLPANTLPKPYGAFLMHLGIGFCPLHPRKGEKETRADMSKVVDAYAWRANHESIQPQRWERETI